MIDAAFVVNVTGGIRKGDHLGPQLDQFLAGKLRHVAGAGDQTGFALQVIVARGNHFGRKINRTVTGGLGADQAAAPVEPLTGQDAGKFIAQFFVHTEQITDLPGTDANISGGHIGIGPDVAE